MKYLLVAAQIGGLYILYLIGTWLKSLLHISIPGSLVGMVLLFILLCLGWVKERWFRAGGELLLKHLQLLFIPPCVGVISYLHFFTHHGFGSIIIVLISTAIVMVSSASVAEKLAMRKVIEMQEKEQVSRL